MMTDVGSDAATTPVIPSEIPSSAIFNSSFCPGSLLQILSDDCRTRLECTTEGETRLLNCQQPGLVLRDDQCDTYLYKDCRYTTEDRRQQCNLLGVEFLPDSKFCHMYYDCEDPAESKVCPYPQLFSEKTYLCEDFRNVTCGSRVEFKSYCQYYPTCAVRCKPCEIDNPSCEGYPDGVHAHGYKTGAGSPWYMVCNGDRFVKEGICSNGPHGFDARVCAYLECNSEIDKYYPGPLCATYIWCYYGQIYNYDCPLGTVFEEKSRSCEHSYNTCQPCGTLTC